MASLVNIEGIGESYAQKLREAGVASQEELLEMGASRAGRQELAEKTGISSKLVLEWVNQADLCRIRGVGEEYADLLEAAGVDTVPELAQRNPDNLSAKLGQVNEEKELVRQMPSISQVRDWVAQAKELPRVVEY